MRRSQRFALAWPMRRRDTSAGAGGRVDFAASRASASALVFLHKGPSVYRYLLCVLFVSSLAERSFAGAAVSDVVRFGMRLLPSPGLVWRLAAARLMGMWAMAALRRHLCFHLLLLLGHCGCSLVGEGWRRCSPTQLVCSAMLDGAV